MRANEIDEEIDKLSQEDIDQLLADSSTDRRCKAEIAVLAGLMLLIFCLCIAHISFYIPEFRPPKVHSAFLLFMVAIVTPYALVEFYKEAHASIVIRATRRLYLHAKVAKKP